jgi:hypothetical protein
MHGFAVARSQKPFFFCCCCVAGRVVADNQHYCSLPMVGDRALVSIVIGGALLPPCPALPARPISFACHSTQFARDDDDGDADQMSALRSESRWLMHYVCVSTATEKTRDKMVVVVVRSSTVSVCYHRWWAVGGRGNDLSI